MALRLTVLNEKSATENRVALVPLEVKKLVTGGIEVMIETGSGSAAYFSDAEYKDAGAEIATSRAEATSKADIIVMLQRPDENDVAGMKAGSIVIGSIYRDLNKDLVELLLDHGIRIFSLELMPRTTRAQSMDTLSSQAVLAGYRASVIGAGLLPRLMPMLTTAAGTVRPASVLVIGAGVAGLMAIATAKRLGASVVAYDVRKSAGEDVRSLGAKFLETGFDAVGEGGYARDLTEEEKGKETEILDKAIANADLIITAAGMPGKKAPVVLSKSSVRLMRPGSVVVDLMAESGGNCQFTKPGKEVRVDGIRVVGPLNAQSEAPINASQMYSRNMYAFLSLLIKENGTLAEIEEDDILSACLIKEEKNPKKEKQRRQE